MSDNDQLLAVTRKFEALLSSLAPELRARQRILTEKRGDDLIVQVLTTFKLPAQRSLELNGARGDDEIGPARSAR